MTLAVASILSILILAVPPQSPEALRKGADVIVVGRVSKVDATLKQSNPEYADTVYAISLDLTKSEKGDVKRGTSILAMTFKPATRPRGWAGPQGQNDVPAAGAIIRAYLRKTGDDAYEFLLPNGLEVITPATQPTTNPASTRPLRD